MQAKGIPIRLMRNGSSSNRIYMYRYVNFIPAGLFLLLSFSSSMALPPSGQARHLTVTNHQLPVLVNKKQNPVMSIMLYADVGGGFRLEELTLDFTGTDRLADIRAVRIFRTPRLKKFDTTDLVGTVLSPSRKQVVRVGRGFSDTLRLWVSLELSPETDLQHTFRIICPGVLTDQGLTIKAPPAGPVILRAGVALRRHQQDGVHTHRIPGLVTTPRGTLLAVYDARRASSRDLQGDIDIGLSRSTDGGRTWEPMQVVLDMKQWGGLPEKFNGVSDANILVDERTGEVYVAGLWMHGVLDARGLPIGGLDTGSLAWNHQWRDRGSQPGYDPRHSAQFLITKSRDDGRTWGAPVNLTSLKDSSWWLWAPAPGHGITLRDGTLVMPTQGRDAAGTSFSNLTYSRDSGRSWQISRPARFQTSECMAAELSDGGIMLNMRSRLNRTDTGATNGRAISVTHDMGETWTVHPGSSGALIEPACMASLHRHDLTTSGRVRSILFFSNPSSKTARVDMTIKASLDDGATWPRDKWLLLDEMNSRGYSCLTSVDKHTLGILYESSQADLVFQQISLRRWLGP